MPTPIPASDCPFDRYNSIFERAVASEPDVPNAATLATATPDGKPSARVVLVKSVNSSGFAFFTIVTDIITLCTRPTGWGGTMTVVNMVFKLVVATHAYRLCDALGSLSAADDIISPSGEGAAAVAGSAGGYPMAYHAPPLKEEEVDYGEAAGSGHADADADAAVGEATRYRAI